MIYFAFIVIIILLIIFIIRTNEISKKVAQLTRDIQGLKSGVASTDSKAVSPSPQPAELRKRSATVPEKVIRKGTYPAQTTRTIKATKPSRTRAEWEALIGGKLLNRIGAVALIIAVGYFLKYAIDNDWINETIRVLIGGAIGAGLILLAYRFSLKGLEIFAQGLVGAGIAILYLSVYASYNFYYLLPQEIAFILMSVVTVTTFLLAMRYNAQAVSLLGLLGGFLTPILLSSARPNEIGLFAYLILLNAGILAVALKRDRWWFLEPLSIISTYVLFSQWYGAYFDVTKLIPSIIFLTIFWGMFFVLDIYRILRRFRYYFDIRRSFAAANGLIYFSLIYVAVDQYYPQWMGLVSMLIGIVYAGAFLLIKRSVPDNTRAHIQYVLSAIGLMIAATTIQFTGFMIIIIWLGEVVGLIWLGKHYKLSYLWLTGLGLFVLALLRLLLFENAYRFTPIEAFEPILNLRALSLVTLSLTAGIGFLLTRNIVVKYTKAVRNIFLYSIPIAVLWLLNVETLDLFRMRMIGLSKDMQAYYMAMEFMILASVWMAHAVVFIGTGLRKNILPFIFTGLFTLLISILEATLRSVIQFTPIADFTLLFNFRAVIILGLILCAFLNVYWLRKHFDLYDWVPQISLILQIGIVILCFTFITGETKDYFDKVIFSLEGRGQDMIYMTENLKQLALSGIWLIYSIILMTFGLWKRQYAIRISAMVLFGITILKIFIYDLSFLDTFYRIFSFFGLGLILLLVSYLYNKYRTIILDQ